MSGGIALIKHEFLINVKVKILMYILKAFFLQKDNDKNSKQELRLIVPFENSTKNETEVMDLKRPRAGMDHKRKSKMIKARKEARPVCFVI